MQIWKTTALALATALLLGCGEDPSRSACARSVWSGP